jgi:hypothetical protein
MYVPFGFVNGVTFYTHKLPELLFLFGFWNAFRHSMGESEDALEFDWLFRRMQLL